MGKTYEALRRAEENYKDQARKGGPLITAGGLTSEHAVTSLDALSKAYRDVATNVMAHRPDDAIKTILVAGASQGDGASTLSVNLAMALTKNQKIAVLLVDINFRDPGLHRFFKNVESVDTSYRVLGRPEPTIPPRKVGPGNLYLIPSLKDSSPKAGVVESTWFHDFLGSVRDKFDYIILDGPPLSLPSESQMLCSTVDGVVLVVRSGKTRRMVAQRVKQTIEEAGGKILGVVLNRRRYYIPDWIYRRL